ncbi:MAG: VOC family protein [Polyangiales bacterium]
MSSFFHLTLRTLDVAEARAFYARVLGARDLDVVRLHAQAIARGAQPHWLGFVDVADVDTALAQFAARGAAPLGPKWVNPEGLEAAPVRDPGGAVVALARPAPAGATSTSTSTSTSTCTSTSTRAAWHVLHTADVVRAKENYAALCCWHFHPPVELAGLGTLHPFSYAPNAPVVGAMRDLAGTTGIHPHWLFHFEVDALDRAVDEARAAGGSVIGPLTIPGSARVAVCDDPQGAAFALCERRTD